VALKEVPAILVLTLAKCQDLLSHNLIWYIIQRLIAAVIRYIFLVITFQSS